MTPPASNDDASGDGSSGDDSSGDDSSGDDASSAADSSRIDGFGDAVDGYHDVAGQWRNSLRTRGRRARAQASERADPGEHENCISWSDATASRDAFATRRDRVRETVLDAIGGLPERPDEPRVERSDCVDHRGTVERSGHVDHRGTVERSGHVDHRGTVERDDYEVERIVLETREDYHVTANCYVPTDANSPEASADSFPAVLLCTGHHPFPKADAATQRACIALARSGIVTLVVDAPGTGERDQYPEAQGDVDPVFHGSGVYAHSLAGQQAGYAGGNVARYFVHDARCALDYLEARDRVDPDRLGVTGTSGGGMLTLYVAVLDDRPAVIAPCCWVCDREHVVDAGFPIDHEQVLHGAIPDDVGVHDLATGLLRDGDPAAICVGAASSDFFPIEGVRAAFDRIENAYDLFDACEDCELRVADRGHAAVSEIPGVLDFLSDRLHAPGTTGDGDARIEAQSIPDDALLDRESLQCTPTGSVRDAYADERSLTDLVAADLVEADGSPESTTEADSERNAFDAGSASETAAEIADRVRDCLSIHDPEGPRDVRVIAQQRLEDRGLDVERVFWRVAHDPPIVVTGVVVRDTDGGGGERSDPDADSAPPAVVCFERGTDELPERTADLAALAREHGAVLAFDPRGVGATRQRPLPATWGDPDYHGVYGTTHTIGVHAALLGESLFAQHVADVTDAIEYLRDRTGSDVVAVRASGVARYHALYAAGAIPTAIASVAAVDDGDGVDDAPLTSFRERATDPGMAFDARLDAVDVLDCDVPAIEDGLAAAGVTVNLEIE